MIDFHTHILPGLDDGSRDIDMTEKMLRMEKAMGVSHIYATPHFYAHRRSVESFLERRNRALAKTEGLLAENPELPEVTAGAEVYYFTGIGCAKQLEKLCIEGTNMLLLELPFTQWNSDIVKDISELMDQRSLHVILAHMERYELFQKDRYVWDRIIDMPLTIQLNCEDIIDAGTLFRRNPMHKTCLDLLSRYDRVIIGSDCHNLTDRKPNLADGRTALEKRCGAVRLKQIDEYTERLFG